MISDREAYNLINVTLVQFNTLVKSRLRSMRSQMTPQEWDAATNALKYMERVALDSASYFSRAKSSRDWYERMYDYAIKNNIDLSHADEMIAMVQNPVEIVVDTAAPAFYKMPEWMDKYRKLCTHIFEWEYDRTSRSRGCRAAACCHLMPLFQMQDELVSMRLRNVYNNVIGRVKNFSNLIFGKGSR